MIDEQVIKRDGGRSFAVGRATESSYPGFTANHKSQLQDPKDPSDDISIDLRYAFHCGSIYMLIIKRP